MPGNKSKLIKGGKETRRRFQISSLIFYGIVVLMLVICILCFVRALSWVNKPFPGFMTYHPPYVGSYSSKDWPGRQAGLKYMDRIITADDQPVMRGQDVVDTARSKGAGSAIDYVVQAEGEIRNLTLPVTIFTLKDFFFTFSLPFILGLGIFSLGIIVYLLKPNTSTSWVFLGLSFCVATIGVTGFEIQASYHLVRYHYVILVMMPATFLHLGFTFPDRKRFVERFPKLEYVVYLPFAAIALMWQIYFSIYPELVDSSSFYAYIFSYKFLGSITRIFTLISVTILIALVIHSVFKASTIQARQRARMILFGVTIAFLPAAVLMLLVVTFKVNFPWNFLPFFIIFFPASIAYSIVRHNLFDADEIIRRTVGYAIVTAVIIGAYAGVSLALNVFVGKYQLAQSQTFPILFTLGIILIFNPLRDRIQAVVDRVFFRKEYDYGAVVEKVGDTMTSLLELPEILKRLTQTFIEDMFIDAGSVMLLNPAGTSYQVYVADGERKSQVQKVTLGRDDPVVQIIEGEKKELTKFDVLEDPKYREVSESCVAKFDALNASLLVPLVYQDQVIGSLNVGEKKSGKSYNRQDVDLLRTLANQGAVAIENARLFQENLEKQRMEEELNIARDLQMSMLPAECPTVEGFDIAAYSVSAMEVGGDFYDFTDMGEDKAGFIIGDVTGKSVSGALVMSASRSVFRMLAEEDLTVSESMMRANRRLKKDVKTGMFVALLFAVLNSTDRTLTLCSAGQTQPIHISAKSDQANLVDTEGDTFPLGILEEADYKETRLQMATGDKIIFYTDGIVEAMNEKEEMFGFERLIGVVESAKNKNAEALLKDILDNVNEFAGEAEQHDDLTVIVLGVVE